MQGNRSIPLPLGKDSSALLNFGQRKSQGELFSSSSKSFHNLRKVVMPRLQLVMFDVLDKKHRGEWVAVLDHLLQLMKQEYSNQSYSLETFVARRGQSVEEFTDLLIVKKAAELFLCTPSSQKNDRDAISYLFMDSLSLAETNALLEGTARRLAVEEDNSAQEAYTQKSNGASSSVSASVSASASASASAAGGGGGSSSSSSAIATKDHTISNYRWRQIKKTPLKKILTSPRTHSLTAQNTKHLAKRLNPVHVASTTTATTLSNEHDPPEVSNSSTGRITDPVFHSSHTSVNTKSPGRLGLSSTSFAQCAMVQQLIKAYRCISPSDPNAKSLKEDLLALCVGSFSRQEVNSLILPSSFSLTGRKRRYDQVSKVWWRDIRRLADEQELMCTTNIPTGTLLLDPSLPSPRKRHRRSVSSSHPLYSHNKDYNQYEASSLHSARNTFLGGGLSLLSAAYITVTKDGDGDGDGDDDDDDDDDDNGADDFEGMVTFQKAASDEEEEEEEDRLGAYMQEDAAIFDFDE